MSHSVITTTIQRVENGGLTPGQDLLAVEEPLEILMGGRNISITMRTPGNDEELAAGFLFSEGMLRVRAQVSEISVATRSALLYELQLRGVRQNIDPGAGNRRVPDNRSRSAGDPSVAHSSNAGNAENQSAVILTALADCMPPACFDPTELYSMCAKMSVATMPSTN
jgi:formate dehydrogenase assembly factor FdhD